MQFFHRVILCGMAALFLTVEAGMAQSIRSERVSFAPGTSGAVLQGSLNGAQIIDYVLNAQGGQRMVVDMSTSNPSAYFNIQPAGSQQAVHNASIEGLHYDGLLPSNGDWVVRVYLMGNAARAGRGRVQRAQPDQLHRRQQRQRDRRLWVRRSARPRGL